MTWVPDPKALGSSRRRHLVPSMWRIPVIASAVAVVVILVIFYADRAAAETLAVVDPATGDFSPRSFGLVLVVVGVVAVGLMVILLPRVLRELDPRPRYARTSVEQGEEVSRDPR